MRLFHPRSIARRRRLRFKTNVINNQWDWVPWRGKWDNNCVAKAYPRRRT